MFDDQPIFCPTERGSYFFNQRQAVNQIPLDRLVGPGVQIDVSDKVQPDRDYLVGIEDLRRRETRQGDYSST